MVLLYVLGAAASVATAQALGGFTWPSWFVLLAPPYYVLLALGGLGLWLLYRPEPALAPEESVEVVHPGRWTAAEWRVAAVTVATSLLWMLDQFTGWPPAVPALLALVVLVAPAVGATSWGAFAVQAPWGT